LFIVHQQNYTGQEKGRERGRKGGRKEDRTINLAITSQIKNI
jgi:hypothetical protein